MKILIITMNVGRTAPGIVFERLIHGLSKMHTIDLLTPDFDPSVDMSSVNKVIHVKRKHIHPRISKLLVSVFGVDLADLSWAEKAIRNIKEPDQYDVVFSFISFNHCASLIAGDMLSKKWKIKHMVYSVDAIPAPIGWLKDDLFYKGTKKLVSKYLAEIDVLFSANQKMLEYQLTTFRPQKNVITGVVYNPSHGQLKSYADRSVGKNVFLYTGGIYGPRRPECVLEAFKELLKEYPDSVLEFVGSQLPANYLSGFNAEDQGKVLVHPFAKDLTPYYERATVLIDIDADLPNDIFLSSKITNYINVNRAIITVTGENSPSRGIFKGIPSIFQCKHDVDEIANAMRQAIIQRGAVDFNDRAEVISMFSLDCVIGKINNTIAYEN